MRWLWVTVFFTAMFWLRSLPVFTPASDRWVWLIIPAILAAAPGLKKAAVKEFDLRWLFTLIPFALAIWQLPFPFSLPVLLCALALLLFASARLSSTLGWVGLPVGLVGLILSVQAALFPFLYMISSRIHELPFLTPVFYWLAKLVSPEVSLSGQQLMIPYVYDVFEFPTRLEALGFIPLSLVAVGGVVIFAMRRRPGRVYAGFFGLLAGYAVLRYLYLVFLVVKYQTAGVFWLPLPMALSLAPLILILAVIPWFNRPSVAASGESPGGPSGPGEDNGNPAGGLSLVLPWPGRRHVLLAASLAAAAALGITGLFAYHDPGVRKQGRVLIEELHSDWEWTTRAYDTTWYGRKSGYNYYCLAEYLNHFYQVEASRDSLLPELLSRFDVVMLKTPTTPYSEREIDALVDFVEEGGGLWLIGDHTNVFGTSTYLNQLAGRFGLRLRYDSTYDLKTLALSVFRAPPVFRHPAVAYLPDYLFATSCTMEAPLLAENMILGYGLKAADLDYARTSFFPRKNDQNYSFGVFLQQGGVKRGKGRVAIFTDSTCFSNFFMFMTGKPELALGTVEWLNRSNRFAWVKVLLFVIGLGCFAGLLVITRRWERMRILAVALPGALLGLALAILIYDGLVRWSYRLPEAHSDYVHVAFESEHSGIELPTTRLITNPEMSLHTFFVWTQRLGFFPSIESSLEDALEKGDLVVIANPVVPFEPEELADLANYVAGGGNLLVLIDPLNEGEAQPQILESLGVCEAGMPGWSEAGGDSVLPHIESLKGEKITAAARPAALGCAAARLGLSDGGTVLAEARLGEGRIFIFSDFFLFTDRNMGHTGEPLDRGKYGIFELEYWILREILDIKQPQPFWEGAGE